jgi:hypothetical protein
MIGWQHPGALWALPLIAVPIIIHLLRLHRSERVLFPSLRFVQPVRTAAVRVRLPSDLGLLLVRMSIVALAVMAAAGPLLVTRARLTAWNARSARAVVVDVSDSMRLPGGDGTTPASSASEAVRAELANAAYGRAFESVTLGDGIARAAAWLSSAPPARREVVVVSDFQRGAFDQNALAPLSDAVGVRLVSIGRAVDSRRFPGEATLGPSGASTKQQTIELSGSSTTVTTERRENPAIGLRLVTLPDEANAASRLLRSVALAGAAAGTPQEPVAIRFAGAAAATTKISSIAPGWMLRTVLRLQEDTIVQSLAGRSSAASRPGDSGAGEWTIVARDRTQRAIVRAATSGNELLVEVDAPTDSLFAATVVRAVLNARSNASDFAEQEIARLDASSLSALNRPSAEVTRDAWRNAESTDARWLWLGTLMLLAFEHWLRERRASRATLENTRAAA